VHNVDRTNRWIGIAVVCMSMKCAFVSTGPDTCCWC